MNEEEKHLLSEDVDHDEQCVQQAKQLLNSGFMEEEFACYGSTYIEQGEIKYYISTTSYSLKQFVNGCLARNIYPSIPKYFVKRTNVTPGSRDMVRQTFKKEAALKLKNDYPQVYFAALAKCGEYKNDNAAMDLLFTLRDAIESTFDKTLLELFAEIVNDCLLSRHLTKSSYDYWLGWLEKEQQKIAEEILDWNYHERTYSGYGVIEQGKMRYRKDGMEMMTLERRNHDIAAGKSVTPILRKQYFAPSDSELLKTVPEFKLEMEKYLNPGLLEIEQEIKKLSPVVPIEEYQKWLDLLTETGAQSAIESFKYYGYLWGCI